MYKSLKALKCTSLWKLTNVQIFKSLQMYKSLKAHICIAIFCLAAAVNLVIGWCCEKKILSSPRSYHPFSFCPFFLLFFWYPCPALAVLLSYVKFAFQMRLTWRSRIWTAAQPLRRKRAVQRQSAAMLEGNRPTEQGRVAAVAVGKKSHAVRTGQVYQAWIL